MAIDAWLAPWSGVAYRHIAMGSPYGVLDFRFAGLGQDNRWNEPGEPTLYLAGDIGVVIAELGRHFRHDRDPSLASALVERTVYRLELELDRVLDLRDVDVCRAIGLQDTPVCFLDRDVARATARYLRRTTPTQAILAPSVATLDQPGRWNLVLFLEKLPADAARFVRSVHVEGPLRWRA